MEIGDLRACRLQPRGTEPTVHRVRIVRIGGVLKSGQVCVLFLDDDPQQYRWVDDRCLVAPWDEVEAYLDDERRAAGVAAASCAVRGSAEFEAARMVLGVARPRGRLKLRVRLADAGVLEVRDLDLVAAWLGLSAHQLRCEPLAFEDRQGVYRAPWPVTLKVAKRVARMFRDEVLAEACRRESGLVQEPVAAPWGRSRQQSRIELRQTALAVARAWCADPGIGPRGHGARPGSP
jgi:hypothetical protein